MEKWDFPALNTLVPEHHEGGCGHVGVLGDVVLDFRVGNEHSSKNSNRGDVRLPGE